MIKATHVSKMYGRLKALSDVSFRIERGEVVGVLGPNGAGKTTLMRILAGYFPSTSGSVEVAGMNMAKNPREIQRMIGYLPETAPLYKELTALEMLTFSARMRGVKRSAVRREVDRAIETCGLSVAARRLIGTLSKGFRQRVALAAALVGSPEILILDEPTNGLDPEQMVEIRQLIRNLSGRHTIILSTHILPEAAQLTRRILIVNEGCLVASDRLEKLREELINEYELVITILGPASAVKKVLEQVPGVKQVGLLDAASSPNQSMRYTVMTDDPADISVTLSRRIVEAGFQLVELTHPHVSLEDIYLKAVRKKAGDKLLSPAEETVRV